MGTVSDTLEARRIHNEAAAEQRSALARHETELRAVEYDIAVSNRDLKDFRAGMSLDVIHERARTELAARVDAEFRSYMRWGTPPALPYAGAIESRDQGIGTSSAGGYFVPARMADQLVMAERQTGSMLRIVNVIDTPDGRPLSRPGIDDTAVSASIIAENTVLGAGTDWVVASPTALQAYQYATLPLKVSWQLDNDVAPGANGGFNLEDQIATELGRRMGRRLNLDLTLGTGSSQPLGAFAAGAMTVGVTLATGNAAGFASTAVALAGMRSLLTSVDPSYWDGACWVGNVATYAALAALVDSQGRPVFGESDSALTPFGFPFVVNVDAPAWAASVPVLGFGNWKRGYTARQTPQAIHRLAERYADNLQTGFFSSVRFDGRPSGDAGAVKMMLASAS